MCFDCADILLVWMVKLVDGTDLQVHSTTLWRPSQHPRLDPFSKHQCHEEKDSANHLTDRGHMILKSRRLIQPPRKHLRRHEDEHLLPLGPFGANEEVSEGDDECQHGAEAEACHRDSVDVLVSLRLVSTGGTCAESMVL